MPLKFIDLFAGLGGFHFALEDLGCECVFASEIKEDLRKLYSINFPGVKIEGDITKIKPEQIPAHDILCAGFPCQPFSQAGKRQGFNDEKDRGNLFNYICDILGHHHPRYVFLENVANLMGHDYGNTWETIKGRLESLGYNVAKPEILSPHLFGIPQHRRRIYIVCEHRDYNTLKDFSFPKVPSKRKCDITKIIDENETDYLKLRPETRSQMAIWQEFIDLCIKNNRKIPSFPIWAMEFGANYDYKEVAPAFQTKEQLLDKKGKLGNPIAGSSVDQCLFCLPIYAQTKKDKQFPDWKIRYIEQNREFYEQNREWLDPWLKKIKDLDNSHLKMEWNCGLKAKPILNDKIIQFRASGIRVKLPTFSPALNLVGTQIPILPWVKLPENTLEKGEPQNGRYMTRHEAALLQGMKRLKFGDDNFQLSVPRSYAAMGNAVNVTIVKHIAKKLLGL
jgi:DNA (cytosine-5)-methyltransferase 1